MAAKDVVEAMGDFSRMPGVRRRAQFTRFLYCGSDLTCSSKTTLVNNVCAAQHAARGVQ